MGRKLDLRQALEIMNEDQRQFDKRILELRIRFTRLRQDVPLNPLEGRGCLLPSEKPGKDQPPAKLEPDKMVRGSVRVVPEG